MGHVKNHKARHTFFTSFDLEDAMRLFKLSTAILAAAILLAVTTGPAVGEIVDIMDSSAFDVKYEFDVDGELPSGFTLYKSIVPTVSGGTMVSDTSADAASYAYFMSGNTQIWDTSGVTWDSGYTIETRIRIDAVAPDVTMGFVLYSVPVGASGPAGWLTLNHNDVQWGYPPQETWDVDNSDDFHTFRFAQEPGTDSYSIWRDGDLLISETGKGWNYNGLVRLLFGDAGGSGGSNYEMDYIRFTPGAYAPVPEPGMLTLLVLGSLSLLIWRR